MTLGPIGDVFEREADAASERVGAGKPVERISRLAAAPGECPACAAERKGGVQRKCATCAQADRDGAGESAGLDTATAERAMADAGAGSPLNPEMRGTMELQFGEDFGDVRVHRGGAADRANRALDARAFTRGSDVYLRRDSSPDDRRLMAHELTHVVQQSPANPSAVQRQPAPPQKDAPTLAAPAPAVDHVAQLRTALGSRRKSDAFAAIKAVTWSEGDRVLADPGMRLLAVWSFEIPEMVEALRLLPGSLGDGAFEHVMRDLMRRRDLGRANALVAAVEHDALSTQKLRRLAEAGRRTDPAARAQAIADELDRSLTEATGLAATRGLEKIDNPAQDLADEWAYVQRQSPLPVEDGEYVAEVVLPNGHKWRQNQAGRWCRFSDGGFCLTSEGLNQIAGPVTPAERVAQSTAPLGAPIYRIDPLHPPDIVPPGVVLEFPNGEPVFRAGDGGIVIESKLGGAIARQHFEAAYFSRGEMELDAYTRSTLERAHSQGAGTGFESPFAIPYAPRIVNQDLQNTGIEQFLRELQKEHPETTFHLITNTKIHPNSRRLSQIEYRIDISQRNVRKPLFQVDINVADRARNPRVDISATAVDPEMVNILETVELPYTIRERLAKIMQGKWKRRVRS